MRLKGTRELKRIKAASESNQQDVNTNEDVNTLDHSSQTTNNALSITATTLHSYIIASNLDAAMELLINDNFLPEYLNALDHLNRTPLYLALLLGRNDFVDMLMLYYRGHINNEAGFSASNLPFEEHTDINSISIPHVVQAGARVLLEYLIDNGVNINVVDNFGNSPLHLAAMNNNIWIARQLIHANVEVNSYDNQHNNALHVAILRNADVLVVNYLVSEGIDLNAQNNNGNTPLHLALNSRNYDVFDLLVSAHTQNIQYVDFNILNNQGQSLLHIAIENNDTDAIGLLVANGANILITPNNYMPTPREQFQTMHHDNQNMLHYWQGLENSYLYLQQLPIFNGNINHAEILQVVTAEPLPIARFTTNTSTDDAEPLPVATFIGAFSFHHDQSF
jgi:ankyrin repeat protein